MRWVKRTDKIAPIMKFAQLFIAGLLLTSANAFAQPNTMVAPMVAPKPALAPLDGANWSAIPVRNVPPSIIAWQLDQKHNAMPAFFNVPYMPQPKYAADYKAPTPDAKRAKGPFDLTDETRLAASDEQNLLFVGGGDVQQIAKVRELVSILDQPLRKVEFEAQFVQLPAAELKQFGISTDAATAGKPGVAAPIEGAISVGFVRDDFQTRLDEIVADGKAKVISTKPQILTNNMGLAISLLSGPIDNTGANQNKPLVAPANGTDTIFTVTPTINGDDTITVLMNIATLPVTANYLGLETVANVRDGETIALTGLKSAAFPSALRDYKVPLLNDIPIIGGLFRSKNVVMFVTARIVRADEN